MPSSTEATSRKRTVWTIVSLIAITLAWYFGIGDHTPSRQDAERFLKWGLDDADGIVGFHDDGTVAQIKAALVRNVEDVECHRDSSDRKFFQRHQPSSYNYDCIYNLAGSDDAKYRTLIRAVYLRTDEFKLAQVGKYFLNFLAEPQQRELFALHGVNLLKS